MEYHLGLPVSSEEVKKLHVGDVIYVSGRVFTARDEAHHMMLEKGKRNIPFDPSGMALFHCGPLMRKIRDGWEVVSAGPTTSSRMELFEAKFLEKYNVKIIIGVVLVHLLLIRLKKLKMYIGLMSSVCLRLFGFSK